MREQETCQDGNGLTRFVSHIFVMHMVGFPHFLLYLSALSPILFHVPEQIGLKGEALSLHTVTGSSSVEWVEGSLSAKKQPLTWYKVGFSFDAQLLGTLCYFVHYLQRTR